MLKTLIFAAACSPFFMACHNESAPKTVGIAPSETVETIAETPPVKSRCFEMTDKMKGKTNLQISINAEKVTGKMDWTAANGERIKGNLTGTIDTKNVIRCTYEHTAQGKKYTNERYFKLVGKTILEGEGQQKADATGVFRYKNPDKVQYKRVMTETTCN
jgi:hypothetical protein